MPGGQGNQWNRCGFLPGKVLRFRNNILTRRRNILRVPTIALVTDDVVFRTHIVASRQTLITVTARDTWLQQHFLTRLNPCHKFANSLYYARNVVSQNVWKRNLYSGQALSYPDVEVIQR